MHDRNGNEIKVGDTVSVDFVVSSVYPGSDFCNVSLMTVKGRKVDGSMDYFTTTADLTRLVDRAPAPAAIVAPELPETLDSPPVPEAPPAPVVTDLDTPF